MLHGLGTALITPFQKNGEVDYNALAQLLDKQIAGSVDFIVVLGTTGEAATMTQTERDSVRDFVVNYIKQHLSPTTQQPIPLVLGVGGNCTAQVLEELKRIHNTLTQHFAAILSVCPFYNKPSQEGLYQHFAAIAEACPIPTILYNVPGRTGVNLLPETAIRLHQTLPHKIIGIKEASGNLEQIKKVCDYHPCAAAKETSFAVFSGDDGIAAEVMDMGGAGLISVASNACPEDFGRIVHEHNHELQKQYAPFVSLLFKEGNPSGIKTVLSQMGLIENVLRLPLVPNSDAVQHEIQAFFQSRNCLIINTRP